MNIKGLIKKFFINVLSKIADHIIVSIIAAGFLLCAIFWKWVTSKYSIELYGGIWLLFCLIFLLLILHFGFIMYDKFRKIKNPSDIRNILERCWREQEEETDDLELTLFFSGFDKTEGLKKGSAKKYLRDIVTKDGKWGIVREGPDTLLVRRYQSKQVEIISSIMKKI